MLHVWVVERFLECIDRPTRHAGVVQDFDPGGRRVPLRHLLDIGVQGFPMRDPARRGGVLRTLQQLRGPECAAELAPHGSRGRDGDVALLGFKHPHGRILRMFIADLGRQILRHRPAGRLEVEQENHRFQQGRLHPLPLARGLAL